MEKEFKDYLDQIFAKLATKEEVKKAGDDINGLKVGLVALEDRVLHHIHPPVNSWSSAKADKGNLCN